MTSKGNVLVGGLAAQSGHYQRLVDNDQNGPQVVPPSSIASEGWSRTLPERLVWPAPLTCLFCAQNIVTSPTCCRTQSTATPPTCLHTRSTATPLTCLRTQSTAEGTGCACRRSPASPARYTRLAVVCVRAGGGGREGGVSGIPWRRVGRAQERTSAWRGRLAGCGKYPNQIRSGDMPIPAHI